MFSRAGVLVLRLQHSPVHRKIVRTFLSDQFKCKPEWESRLSPEFMKKLKLENLYYNIDHSFQHQGKVSAIDVDIFVNRITSQDEIQLDETADLLHKLRMGEETSNSLDSTSHAVIRNYIDMGQIIELLTVLDDRLSYGVFLDNYSASYALDSLIKNKDYTSAAKVSVQLMLQEDLEHELSRALALYACYKYLENPEQFYPPIEENSDEAEKKEEIKVRVAFLRNEFFDDHFDIKDNLHLVGKTLTAIGSKLSTDLGKSIQLLGYVLYQKYGNALELVKSEKSLYSDSIKKCLNFLEKKSEGNDILSSLKILLEKYSNANANSLENEIEKLLKNVVISNERKEIDKQKEIYLEWNKLREEKLNEEIARLDRAKRLKEIKKITEEMKSEEQKLWFFENEDKVDLQIDSKKVTYPKRWFGKLKKPRVIDEGYIPPEITKQRK